MKPLKQENLKELTEKVYELIAKTSVEIGHRSDGKSMAALAKIFAADLIKEKLYCPKKQGSFRMMFGFATPYIYANRRTISGIKKVYYTKLNN